MDTTKRVIDVAAEFGSRILHGDAATAQMFYNLSQCIEAEIPVVLDMCGIDIISLPSLHGFYGALFGKYPTDVVDKFVSFEHVPYVSLEWVTAVRDCAIKYFAKQRSQEH